MSSRLHQLTSTEIVVADGGMGSMLHQMVDSPFRCTDETNLTHPDTVLKVHLAYLQAGSRMIETNTFGANRLKLARFGLEDQVSKINSKAVKLAREAREIAGKDALIAGSIGPTDAVTDHSDAMRSELIEVFSEQASALDDRGVDMFVLETFSDPWELKVAVDAVRKASGLPILAQLTLPAADEWSDEDGYDTTITERLDALAEIDADALGLNCSRGPAQMLSPLRYLSRRAGGRPLSVQPNSGLPRRAGGRFLFPATDPEYYRQFALDAAEAGASIIGGCCGTTPEQIRAMAEAITKIEVRRKSPAPITELPAPARKRPARAVAADGNTLRERFARGEFVVSMQVDPPKGIRTDLVLDAVRAFRDAGVVSAVDVNSNPMARLHMDSLWMSALIEREGVETIAHYTPRDASLMGIQGNLLGAWNMGVRNVLVITGDPSMVHGEPGSTDVYQTDSVGLVKKIRELNDGRDCFGNNLGSPPDFHIGVAVNPNAEDLDLEVDRYKAKIDNGAQFAMTQVFFEWHAWERFLDRLGGSSPIPVMSAVWPLTSFRLAQRLHNEVPGIVVPDHVLKRLHDAGPEARREGFDIARQILRESRERMQGSYIIAPFKRPKAALELFED